LPRLTALFLLVALCVALLVAMAASAAHGATKRPPVVAVVDSGVTPVGPVASRIVPGIDLIDPGTTSVDGFGHGTEMANIAAATCRVCSVMPVRVLGGSGMGPSVTVALGVQWAAAHGASVISLSVAEASDDPTLDLAVENAARAGIPVIVAAGNAGQPHGYPSETASDSIAVGSICSNGIRCAWSNYGPWVDLWTSGTFATTNMFGKTLSVTGTSASAAYVSGIVGNMLAAGVPASGVLTALRDRYPTTAKEATP
jgi:hypothetical protein